MNFSRLFIRRSILTTLSMVAIILFGLIAYFQLPVSDLPSVDFPTINVSASLPGANPDTMASAVATPLEQQFATIAGLSSMNSTSSLGNTSITLQFDLSRNIDAAAQDVQTAIAAAGAFLPPMPTPPTYKKVNPADQPILYLALSSDSLPLYKVDDYAETLVGQRISMINGVAQVNVFGSQKFAVHVQLDPDALAAYGIGIDDVTSAIQTGNVNMPTGSLYGRYNSYTLQANGQLTNASQYGPLVVAYKNGSPVHINDIGRAIDSVQNDKQASWYNGKRAIVLAIMRQPGTNTVAIVNEIKRVLPKLREQIPGSVELQILYDRSTTIRNSVGDVEFTLMLTISLVIMVIFLFLRNVSATLIPSLALPTSLIGTFAAMYMLGFSLNNLSLMALTLSVGFVVDDAVVVLENIVRHVEAGENPYDAAMKGTAEIGFTVLTMTISLVAVFIPILFMGGIIGRLFNEFAVSIAVAILLSGLVSLTFTPMLCSRWLHPGHIENRHVILEYFERGWNWTQARYETTLNYALERRFAVVMILIASIIVTAMLFVIIPKGFMPTEDTSQIMGTTEASQSISFESMIQHQQEAAAICAKDPDVIGVMSSVGGNSTSNQGRIFLTLKPVSQRIRHAEEIINSLRPKLNSIPGLRTYLQIPPTIRIGGQLTKSLYQVTLMSPDTGTLYSSTQKLMDAMQRIPGLVDVTSDVMNSSPQVNIKVDRQMAAALGVTEQQVETALADAYGMRQVSTIYAPTNQYRVIVELQPQFQRDPVNLTKLYVRSASGTMVPLSAVAKLTAGVGPLVVNHLGQFPSATISFNLQPGASLGTATQQIRDVAQRTVASDVTLSFQGQAQAFESSLSNMGWLLLLAMAVIYTILGMLYESYIHPLTILSGLPAAGLGALLMLLVCGVQLDIYGFLGLVMLIGIVKKNAIMMIDFALEAERNEHVGPEDAIYRACLVRFRPIMMTTLAALMGSIPIALGIGAGAESRRPLGLAVCGGLIVSQLLTLYITPVLYIYLDRAQTRFTEWRARRRESRQTKLEPETP